jgi:molybdopterin synthase sulfur carrier subunit
MKIQIKYFASLREALSTSNEEVILPEDVRSVSDLRCYLISRSDLWANALAQGRSIRIALNHEMINEDALLADGVEVAFFPPVTGG